MVPYQKRISVCTDRNASFSAVFIAENATSSEIAMVFAIQLDNGPNWVEQHSGSLTILVLSALILGTLLVLVPQLLRSHQRTLEMLHEEHMKSLEQGLPLLPTDDRSLSAGRIALLVPMVVIISAATVTCFLVAYQAADHMFAVTLAVWCVAGVVSLAAITGGVALMGRLAQLSDSEQDEEVPSNPLKG
jgi:hypothetical protein